jgi:hypothetical protein
VGRPKSCAFRVLAPARRSSVRITARPDRSRALRPGSEHSLAVRDVLLSAPAKDELPDLPAADMSAAIQDDMLLPGDNSGSGFAESLRAWRPKAQYVMRRQSIEEELLGDFSTFRTARRAAAVARRARSPAPSRRAASRGLPPLLPGGEPLSEAREEAGCQKRERRGLRPCRRPHRNQVIELSARVSHSASVLTGERRSSPPLPANATHACSGLVRRRQKRPLSRQQFLKRLIEPHGHKSLLPRRSTSSTSPPLIAREPRFT